MITLFPSRGTFHFNFDKDTDIIIEGKSEPEYAYGKESIKNIINNGFSKKVLYPFAENSEKFFFSNVCNNMPTKAIVYDVTSRVEASNQYYSIAAVYDDYMKTIQLKLASSTLYVPDPNIRLYYNDFSKLIFLPMAFEFYTGKDADQMSSEAFWSQYMVMNSLKCFSIIEHKYRPGSSSSNGGMTFVSKTVPVYAFTRAGGSNGYSTKYLSLIGSNSSQNKGALYESQPLFTSVEELYDKYHNDDTHFLDTIHALNMGGIGFFPSNINNIYGDNGIDGVRYPPDDFSVKGIYNITNPEDVEEVEVKSGIWYQEPNGYGILITTKNPTIYNLSTE